MSTRADIIHTGRTYSIRECERDMCRVYCILYVYIYIYIRARPACCLSWKNEKIYGNAAMMIRRNCRPGQLFTWKSRTRVRIVRARVCVRVWLAFLFFSLLFAFVGTVLLFCRATRERKYRVQFFFLPRGGFSCVYA